MRGADCWKVSRQHTLAQQTHSHHPLALHLQPYLSSMIPFYRPFLIRLFPLLFIRLKEKLISLLNPSVLGTIHYNEIDCGNILNPLFSAPRRLPPSSFVLVAVCVRSFFRNTW